MVLFFLARVESELLDEAHAALQVDRFQESGMPQDDLGFVGSAASVAQQHDLLVLGDLVQPAPDLLLK